MAKLFGMMLMFWCSGWMKSGPEPDPTHRHGFSNKLESGVVFHTETQAQRSSCAVAYDDSGGHDHDG